ncbi:MAG: YebC/PmpR family DNA-binding transcriptional regulator [Bacteroidia bacterium]
MAGHSKWANIKHRKGAQDKKRGKLFSRLVKEIAVSVKEGGPDPDANPRLRVAIKNASKASVPKDRIQGAINKGSGNDGTSYEEVTLEGYAPHGIAVFVECLTDNNKRTVQNVRAVFSKYGGSMGKNGSVDYLFERKGIFVINKEGLELSEDDLMLELMDGGLEEFESQDEAYIASSAFEDFGALNSKLEELNIEAESSTLERMPLTPTVLDMAQAESVFRLLEKLEEDEDVQQVFHNVEMTEEIASRF